ncbi:hypothetical protein GQ55_1G076500 [Panicum hallii var. hallii]|uniref:Uncharacterized protein n=1 Tax=Panicum hallii var. hallii TaxID=1504633 RepID=A0A2T7F3C8_9POAL|nr:hypothetical protein GQ55_1G076500 [Panicum hallii var. hallii]
MRLDTTHLFVHRRALGAVTVAGAEDGRGPCPGSSRFGTWLASIPDAGRLGSSRLRPPSVLALSAPLSALPGSPNMQYTRWRTTVSSGRTMRMVGISVLYRLGTYTPTTKYKYHLNLSNPLLTACFRKILLSVCALPLPFDWGPGIS